MGGFKAKPISKIKAAFVGVGDRGRVHARNFKSFKGTEIVGICDLYETRVKKTISSLNKEKSIKCHAKVKPKDPIPWALSTADHGNPTTHDPCNHP